MPLMIQYQINGFSLEYRNKIHQAVDRINYVLNSQEFKRRIYEKDSFDFYALKDRKGKGKDVYEALELFARLQEVTNTPIQISPYPFYNLGITYGKVKNIYKIELNQHLNRLKRSIESIANTIFHETLHIIGFAHGDNRPENKENSVPWFIGNLMMSLDQQHDVGIVKV
jgi:hypothetical protein